VYLVFYYLRTRWVCRNPCELLVVSCAAFAKLKLLQILKLLKISSSCKFFKNELLGIGLTHLFTLTGAIDCGNLRPPSPIPLHVAEASSNFILHWTDTFELHLISILGLVNDWVAAGKKLQIAAFPNKNHNHCYTLLSLFIFSFPHRNIQSKTPHPGQTWHRQP
jgi:hypothetical protein